MLVIIIIAIAAAADDDDDDDNAVYRCASRYYRNHLSPFASLCWLLHEIGSFSRSLPSFLIHSIGVVLVVAGAILYTFALHHYHYRAHSLLFSSRTIIVFTSHRHEVYTHTHTLPFIHLLLHFCVILSIYQPMWVVSVLCAILLTWTPRLPFSTDSNGTDACGSMLAFWLPIDSNSKRKANEH